MRRKETSDNKITERNHLIKLRKAVGNGLSAGEKVGKPVTG